MHATILQISAVAAFAFDQYGTEDINVVAFLSGGRPSASVYINSTGELVDNLFMDEEGDVHFLSETPIIRPPTQ